MLGYRNIPTDKQAYDICMAFSFVLNQLYTGYLWQVGMNQDVVHIQNMTLNTENGYTLPLDEFDVRGKKLREIGGEILERHRVKRGKRDQSVIAALPKDIRGNCIPDRG